MEKFGCSAEDFSEAVFWRCFHAHAKPAAKLIQWFNPDFFADDLDFIRFIGKASDAGEIQRELELHRYHPHRGLLRRWLRIRLSGRELIKLGTHVLSKARAVNNSERL